MWDFVDLKKWTWPNFGGGGRSTGPTPRPLHLPLGYRPVVSGITLALGEGCVDIVCDSI